jgi:serine/threonine-protein kinase HipA
MEPMNAPEDFHSRCAKSFFGPKVAPILDYGLEEMEKVALKVIRSHAAIPGVQAKISLDLQRSQGEGKAGRLTLVGLWGGYILKPPTKRYPALPEVEAVSMSLADACQISTVPHALIRLRSGELSYITRRVDREKQTKIAMEDLCQLTGRLTEDKYKGSLEQVGRVIRQYSSQPGLDAVNFFELALFCFLTGNADMHLKNFSLWRPSPNFIQLAPAYDLVATHLLLPKDPEETALTLNGKKKNLRRKDFDALAKTLELPDKARDNAYAKMSHTWEPWQRILNQSFLTETMKDGYQRIIEKRMAILF